MSIAVKGKSTDLTDGPILIKIIKFSLPLIFTAVLQLLFNTADSVVVGRWGGDTPDERALALAAVGSCGALINLIVNLFMGLSVGAGVCVAHDIGSGKTEEIEKTVHTSVSISFVSGVAVTAIGLIAAPKILVMMNTDSDILKEAVPYIRAYFCGMPASIVYNYCAAMLRSSGDTSRPLAFLVVGGFVNVLLNLVMVTVFDSGAMGVGVATAASQWVSCILVLVYMMRTSGYMHLSLKKLGVDRAKMKKILLIGLPAGIQSSLFSISNVIVQSAVNSLGKIAVAGNTAASNVDSYIYATQNALHHTAITFVGQNVGAKRYDRLGKVTLWCSISVVAVGVCIGGVMRIFATPLLGFFVPGNTAVIESGLKRLAIMCYTYFLCGLMEVGSGVMRGMGKSMVPMIVSLTGSCLLRIIWVWTVFEHFGTYQSLYISYPVTWAVTALAHYICSFITVRKLKRS